VIAALRALGSLAMHPHFVACKQVLRGALSRCGEGHGVIESHPSGFTGRDIPPDDVFNQCVRCGLCLPTCPTYVETLVETSSPRGRIALIKAVAEERLDLLSPGFVHQMSECLDCRACEAVCPSGVAYGQLLEPARTQIVRANAPARSWTARLGRSLVLGRLFADMRLMRFLARLLRFYQRSGVQRAVRASGILKVLGLAELEPLAPRISENFFVPRDQRWSAHGTRKATVFLHAGCIMHVAFAGVNDATVRVLQRAGCEVLAPAAQGCCGAITVHAGEMERGRELAKRNIVAFECSGADVYVINAAGCGSTLKEYGELFAGDAEWETRATAFSEKVRDITEFLDGIGLGPGLGRLEATVTYQEPCHLAHAQRITAAPRRLLAQIPGVHVREMAESSLCCGSAGIYNLTQPEMARRLQRRKVEHIVEVDPQIVVTANPGCAMQLANGLALDGRTIAVQHIVELIDASYARGDADSRM
jgi:glycolate oxidase iron-sulfur subunit